MPASAHRIHFRCTLVILDAVRLGGSRSLRNRKEQLVVVGIPDLNRVVTPPDFSAGNRTLGDFTAKICQAFGGQRDEQARLVSARRVLAENDLALAVIHLADRAGAVTFVPGLFEAEAVAVETCRGLRGDEELRTRVRAVNDLGHPASLIQATVENSSRYFANPDTPCISASSSTRIMKTSSGRSHSHVMPRARAGVNPNRG
jgi:hypothetical protein